MNKWLRAVGIVVLVIIIIYGIIAINLYSSVGRFPTGFPRPAPAIKSLVWPTIGYPELVAPGSEMSAEVYLPRVSGRSGTFTAILKPVRPELAGLEYSMGAQAYAVGASEHWPKGTRFGEADVWRIRFALPPRAVPELYDLTVTAALGGGQVTDTQPHAVSVTHAGADKAFTFVSLADIHVHQRNISGFMTPQSNKGIAPDGTPVFFERAIEEVNLLRPDFVVMLGDYVRAQTYAGEYQPEFANFYKSLARFRVPVFMVAGNHDAYYNEVDGVRVYEENIGPLFYSFDAGTAHFTAVNTNQWPARDRMMMEKFNLFVYPRKWQGQVAVATDERKPETYRGQLAWLRDDLAAHQGSSVRFMFMHHDPFRPKGKAVAWRNERFGALYTLGGGGLGSTALKELSAKYRVGYVMTGHWHSDYIDRIPWIDRDGFASFVNQTMVTYDEGGMKDSYPGYRTWNVQGKEVTDYTYLDTFHSVPLYDGSVLNGMTDLDRLDRPAISLARGLGAPSAFYVDSYLGEAMEVRGLTGVFPARSAHKVANGELYQAVPLPSNPSLELLYIRARVGAGVPGTDSATPGDPAKVIVTVD